LSLCDSEFRRKPACHDGSNNNRIRSCKQVQADL
jgi:hypothetical protein